jgi:5'-3' exonuclease
MGIPYYVASLLRTHKHIQQDTGNVPLECDALGLDFNAFIHTYLKPEHPIGSVVMALRNFLRDVARGKKILIAFDGLVPYAKIVQQRYRRMKNPEPSLFDKNQISFDSRSTMPSWIVDDLQFSHKKAKAFFNEKVFYYQSLYLFYSILTVRLFHQDRQ